MNMWMKIHALVLEYDMLPPGATVLCAVSGGVDSMCLLHLLAAKAGEVGFAVAVAHYNHRLRGTEAERDEVFVREWCDANGIPCVIRAGEVRQEAKRLGLGLEEAARQMRYAFLSDTAEALGAERIATAHHADDNAETLLLHLVRGSGLQGLTGIPPRRGAVVRPLLTTTRAEIEAYVSAHGVPFVKDGSNFDTAYTRNKLRHTVMPLLRELNPQLTEHVSETVRYLRADNDFLNAQAAQIAAHARWAEDNLVLEARYLADAPAAVASRAARQLLEMLGDGSVTCTAAHLNAIVDLCRGEDPSASCSLPHNRRVQRVYRDLLFTTQQNLPKPFPAVKLAVGKNDIPGTNWTIILSALPPQGLVARPRELGDELTLPKRGRKRIKKLFIDEKIPRQERDQIPVVANGDGVLALAGFGMNTAHPNYATLEVLCVKTAVR